MPDLATKEWRLIREETWPGPICMALDAVAAETAARGGPRTVRVYQWEPSTLSLGYRQDPTEIDWAYTEREGITVTRRPTGGGGIYHDTEGDISYSIIAPASELPTNLMESYELLCEPLLDACEAMGVPARLGTESAPALYEPACYLRDVSPAHDVLYEGRKLSGNAQYRQRDSVIQHGSLTYRATPERTRDCFVGCELSIERIRERITSITDHSEISRDAAVRTLEDTLGSWAYVEGGAWTEEELERANEIADAKFRDDQWNRNGEDPTAT